MPWIAERSVMLPLLLLAVFFVVVVRIHVHVGPLLHTTTSSHGCHAFLAVRRHVHGRRGGTATLSFHSRFLVSIQKKTQRRQVVVAGVDIDSLDDSSRDDSDNGNDTDEEEEEYLYAVLNTALVQAQTLMRMDSSEELPTRLQALFYSCRNSVETRQSTISNNAGSGLFVASSMDSIPAGTVVSFYPVHAVGVNHWKGKYCIGATDSEDQEYFQSVDHDSSYLLNLIGDRVFPGEQRLVETYAVQPYIDTNPTKKNDRPDQQPGWMAHMVNDCASTDLLQLLLQEENNAESTALEYYKQVVKGQNCVLVPFGPAPICAAVTTKDVAKGDELFVGYGYLYWSEYFDSPKAATSTTLPQQQQQQQPVCLEEKETRLTSSTDENSRLLLSLEKTLFDEIRNIVALVEDRYSEEAEEMEAIFQAIIG